MADDRDDTDRERTTIVETGGGGGGGVLAVVLLIIVVLVLLYVFRGQLGFGLSYSVIPSTVNVNVNHSCLAHKSSWTGCESLSGERARLHECRARLIVRSRISNRQR